MQKNEGIEIEGVDSGWMLWEISKTQLTQVVLQKGSKSKFVYKNSYSSDWLLLLYRPVHMTEGDELLMKKYPPPFGSDDRIAQILQEPTLTADNYCARMHSLLYIEEIAQYANISRSVVSLTTCICWTELANKLPLLCEILNWINFIFCYSISVADFVCLLPT